METLNKWLIRRVVANGWGKAKLMTLVRHGLTSLGAMLTTLLVNGGVDPLVASGAADYLVALAPVLVSVAWSYAEHKFGVQVAKTALASDPEKLTSVDAVKAAISADNELKAAIETQLKGK